MRPWGELEKLVERGLVRRIGLSNAGPAFVEHLFAHASVKPAVNQVEGAEIALVTGGPAALPVSGTLLARSAA